MITGADLQVDEEEFHSSYRVFLNALTMLSFSPERQCEAMGDLNVAWELKDDVGAGKYLVGRGHLNVEQEAWVLALVGAVEEVPAQVLPAGARREVNLAAMHHASWIPLRAISNLVLEALKSFTERNAAYLHVE